MSLFPKYTFDSNTDYNAVLVTVKEMYSYLDAQNDGCCKSSSIETVMRKASIKLLAVGYNAAGDLNDVERWKKGIKIAYLLLYPLT